MACAEPVCTTFSTTHVTMHRTLPTLLLLLLAPLLAAQADTCTATLADIRSHIGEIVVFCGTPSQVSAPENVKGDPVYLNFGGQFPHHTFYVLIWGDVAGKQRNKLAKRYSAKNARISGWVKEHKGLPVIYLKDLKEIVVE